MTSTESDKLARRIATVVVWAMAVVVLVAIFLVALVGAVWFLRWAL